MYTVQGLGLREVERGKRVDPNNARLSKLKKNVVIMIALGGMSPRGWLTVYSTVMCTVYMYCTYWDAVPWLVGCTVGDSLMTDEWRTCPSVSAPSVASSAPLPQLTLTSV